MTAAGAALACTLSLGPALAARADDVQDQKRQADRRISALGQQLEGTNTRLAGAYVNLERTKAALPGARQRLAGAQATAGRAVAAQARAEDTERRALAAEARARAHNEQVAQRLAVAKADEARARERLGRTQEQLRASQDALDAYAAEVFQSGGDESPLGLVFGTGSPQDLADRVVMADTASNVAGDTVDRLATIRADDISARAYLTSVRGEVAELKRQAETALQNATAAASAATRAKEQAIVARQNAETARANAASAKTHLDRLKSEQTAYARDLRAQQANEQADLAAARAEAARLNAILVERARLARLAEQRRNAPPAATPSNYLSHPANGPTTSGFGMRWHPILKKWMLHDGLDWAVACGTPVYAAAPGQVIRAGWRPSGWGNQVVIDHGMHRGVDLVTTYNHLSRIVKWGGHVNRGQLVGYSGTTGYSTGCHLHFGVYEDGTPVDPYRWL
ncbi:peptidoglycan DD-metalloendopeptidase family protein [Intrasporangium sp.]|uniref:peptidoglycan DD-metalloendopeptidase family protein n=1 Tax=Intrasporangium sp. TaxID=1925024 RepID=UPI0032214A13